MTKPHKRFLFKLLPSKFDPGGAAHHGQEPAEQKNAAPTPLRSTKSQQQRDMPIAIKNQTLAEKILYRSLLLSYTKEGAGQASLPLFSGQ